MSDKKSAQQENAQCAEIAVGADAPAAHTTYNRNVSSALSGSHCDHSSASSPYSQEIDCEPLIEGGGKLQRTLTCVCRSSREKKNGKERP